VTTTYAELSLWIVIPAAMLITIGAALAFVGSLGLVRLASFYERLHAPSLAAGGATLAICLASAILMSQANDQLVLHELVIYGLTLVVTPVSLITLAAAATHRDAVTLPDRQGAQEGLTSMRGGVASSGTTDRPLE
jgi:multicomponent K+:H+ antiporter subunit G